MKRSKFNLSFNKLFSCDMGELVPCGLVEVLPGDTFQHNCSALVRCAPMLAPIMHPCHVRIHHWFIPHRLVWDGSQPGGSGKSDRWEEFITGGPDGLNTASFPTVNLYDGNSGTGTLADYLGLPTGTPAGKTVSALPFRAYQLVWNEWYRDQDLQTPAAINLAGGADSALTSYSLQSIAWEKDYFTSSRPWEQKGPTVTIPIGQTAPLKANTTATGQIFSYKNNSNVDTKMGVGGSAVSPLQSDAAASATYFPMYADLTNASAVTVNALRQALAIQRFEENRARYGSRYTEYLRALGVKSSDARLQRPEYLGGGHQTIQFSEVLQTGVDNSASPSTVVGQMRGHGITGVKAYRYRKFFEEHGYVMTLFSVRPKTIYMNGAQRTWNRRVKEDFWQPELQHIGQQKVLNKEIYFNHTTPDGTFGYQDRYDEYRRKWSEVSGEFRTSLLNFWHLARDFSSDPALNASFVQCSPSHRIFSVPSQDTLYVMMKHNLVARRLVSKTGASFIK